MEIWWLHDPVHQFLYFVTDLIKEKKVFLRDIDYAVFTFKASVYNTSKEYIEQGIYIKRNTLIQVYLLLTHQNFMDTCIAYHLYIYGISFCIISFGRISKAVTNGVIHAIYFFEVSYLCNITFTVTYI